MITIKKQFILALIILTAVIYSGCGTDDSVTPIGGGGWPPDFNFMQNQSFVYTTDSITTTGIHISKRSRSTDVVGVQIPIDGQSCYPFAGSTYDSIHATTTPELYYVRYDHSSGKYYQYGIRRLVDTNLAPTWDLVGDFSAARGTSYSIGTIDYTIPLPPPYNSIHFTGPLTGKVADSLTIKTTSTGENIYCYRVEMDAEISGTYSGLPIAASIFIDYYIGYSNSVSPTNPVGLVRLNPRPFTFSVSGIPVPSLSEPGYDRVLYSHNP